MGKYSYKVTFAKGPAWYVVANCPSEARVRVAAIFTLRGTKPKTIKAVEKDQTL